MKAIPDAPSLFLTIEETAREIACTPRHVQNLIARSELPAVRFGRAVRIPRTALVALANGTEEHWDE